MEIRVVPSFALSLLIVAAATVVLHPERSKKAVKPAPHPGVSSSVPADPAGREVATAPGPDPSPRPDPIDGPTRPATPKTEIPAAPIAPREVVTPPVVRGPTVESSPIRPPTIVDPTAGTVVILTPPPTPDRPATSVSRPPTSRVVEVPPVKPTPTAPPPSGGFVAVVDGETLKSLARRVSGSDDEIHQIRIWRANRDLLPILGSPLRPGMILRTP